MKFTYNGTWHFGTNATVSDKIKKSIFALLGKSETPQTPAAIFGEAMLNSEIHWEASCELNVEDFIAIQKEARENDNHILEWYKKFGKDLLNGIKETVSSAKEIVPEIQKISQDYKLQEIKNEHERTMVRFQLRKEERAEEKSANEE